MAVLKCKMCGGTMEMTNESVAVCDFCGTKQTVPTVKDENLQGLFNRANALRIKCEFDKAEQLYEKIISADNTQAEAYWGLILCKYGIEYVEDPATFKRVPTCHRTSFDSIIADDDYAAALDFADVASQMVYEAEAKEIDRLQKEILALSQKEEPYDVFICYKETDDTGKRTQDSVIANDIYYQLTQEGFKVFYAAITLEDKLGSAYEPCIFAALNSSKVMLAIGTKSEYFSAVWVKNEWSRYLKLMKKDRSKLLIPCYRDMDAYELPDEFAHLQAQDMSKIGFINDVVRGIKKVIVKDEPAPVTAVVKETVVQQNASNATTDSLLKRAFMFLEDGNWTSANEYCEKVLDIDPECAKAYLGELMSDLKVRNRDDLKNQEKPFDDRNAYKKAIRFGDDELGKELQQCIDFINNRNSEAIYQNACSFLEKGTIEYYREASKLFASLSGYKDAEEMSALALNKAEEATRIAQETARIKAEEAKEIERIEAEKREERIRKVAKYHKLLAPVQNILSVGANHSLGLKADGTVVAIGDNDKGQCDVSSWTDIVAVSAGGYHSLGLKANGKVVAVGSNEYGQCDVSKGSDIVAVSAGLDHSLGLKANGTVVAGGGNRFGQLNVRNWTNIVAVAAGSCYSLGLKSDGTVVAVGYNEHGECNVGSWTDIVAISTVLGHSLGLKSDGTVVAVGHNGESRCNVNWWSDIVAVAASNGHSLGLKSDGTVSVLGYNDNGQCNVNSWTDIVAISAGRYYSLGLKSDGTVLTTDNRNLDTKNWRLFDDFASLEKRQNETKEILKEIRIKAQRRANGTCQHCGGSFKGILFEKCKVCGKPKDY